MTTQPVVPYLAPDDHLLRPEQVAERLACKPGMVYKMVREGRLTAVQVGRLVRVRKSDFDAYLAALEPIKPTVAVG